MTEAPEAGTDADPYATWVYDSGAAYLHPGLDRRATALSCVFEFSEPVDLPALAQAAGEGGFACPVLWAGSKTRFVPAAFVDPTPVEAGRVARMNTAFARNFGAGQARANLTLRDATLNMDWHDAPGPAPCADASDPIVIVAIIDDGIPFAHRNFACTGRNGTRIDYCWSQSATKGGYPMLCGQEFDKARIDALYAEYDGDEEAVYRAAGLAGDGNPNMRLPLDKAHSHGAHILDLLAGNAPGTDVGDQDRVHIIAVDLPAMTSAETSGFGKDMFLLSALHYIFDRADQIARAHAPAGAKVPLVINLSYGHSGGAHDGTGVLEAAMDEMIAARRQIHPTALVMPSGNMFLQSIHGVVDQAQFDAADGPVELKWFIPPQDRTSTYLEIWYPAGVDPSDYKIELMPPKAAGLEGDTFVMPDVPDAPRSRAHRLIRRAGFAIGQLSTEKYRCGRWRHVVSLAPTEAEDDVAVAPAGVWRLRLTAHCPRALPEFTQHNGQKTAGGLQLWIQRDEDFGGAGTGARQSYFIDPNNALWDDTGAFNARDSLEDGAFVRRFGTLSGMATGALTLRVAGHVHASAEAARYSCAGGVRRNTHAPVSAGPQVAASAMSERSWAHWGVVAAGTRTGIQIALGGTSAAAPQVARALSMLFLDNPDCADQQSGDYAPLLPHIPGAVPVPTAGMEDPGGQERLGATLIRTDW
ncbi:hypothetical protein [uncultured Tateyamaria sp.]|uniref:hypothetical protein n=1 Tax=uncultured Tateyamaria sp. TaxID=455651 RepID=UPI002638475F|nr:hypothetical protein [uncultured Tateyamaria sp.]